jgi:sugar lactone lactonase YvrE
VLLDSAALLGEGPRWDAAARRLLWVDIEARELHLLELDPLTDRMIALDDRPGAAAPMTDGRVLVALAGRLVAVDLADESVEPLAIVPHGADMRLNDGACDPAGRFWVGSLELGYAAGRGTLYRFDGALEPVLDGVTISNGIGWSADGTRMYYVDTMAYGVDVLDFDVATGAAANRRRLATIERGVGAPDGLAVDDDGCIWVAFWGGSAIRRYDPSGRLDRTVPVPPRNPTACAFAGERRDLLVVTSAAPDGRIFVHEPGVTGPPARPFDAGRLASTAPPAAGPTSAV